MACPRLAAMDLKDPLTQVGTERRCRRTCASTTASLPLCGSEKLALPQSLSPSTRQNEGVSVVQQPCRPHPDGSLSVKVRSAHRMSANEMMPIDVAEYATTAIAASCNSLPHAPPAASGMTKLPAPPAPAIKKATIVARSE